jgi:hypothetical protein
VVGAIIGNVGPGFGAVQGAPFSAEVIDESEQFLADGNRIHRETHGRIFRDSQGRTRTENKIGGMGGSSGITLVHIADPVEHTFISLNVAQKTAIVHHYANFTAPQRETQRTPRANSAPAGSGGGLIAGLPASTGNGHKIQNSQEDLGTSDIEGFSVRGTRNVFVIPAGTVGNDKPMTNTNERWYSEDLKTELLTKSERPQSGKHIHKLVNIRTGDPDPLLFQVPPDYTVKEETQR